MDDDNQRGIHWSVWAIGAVGLVWNVLGCMNYLGQMNADVVASMPDTHRAIIAGRPAWATGGFAVAVFGGALGCILLLLRRSASFWLFAASLLGVVVTMVHTLGIAGDIDFSPFEIVMMIVMPLLVAAFLAWYSKNVQARGWTR